MDNLKVEAEMVCAMSSETLDLGTQKKRLDFTVFDLNDNLINVDKDSENVKIYRQNPNFQEVKNSFPLMKLVQNHFFFVS